MWFQVPAGVLDSHGRHSFRRCHGHLGWTQHAILPGPNSGWSEAATAGALQRRLVGPIWLNGELKTDVWIGDPADPPLETRTDLLLARALTTIAALVASSIAAFTLFMI